jgi:hypothetical protein
MNKDFVVYLHRKKSDNSIFYVGAGSSQRPFKKSRPLNWKRIVEEHGVIVEIVKDNLTKEESFELEKKLISEYGRIDLGTGCLINCSEGGPGCAGLSMETEQKKIDLLKSIKKTDEWKKKISEGHKGIIKDEAWRSKISNSLKGRKLSEEVKQKMRASNRSKEISSVPIICYEYKTDRKVKEFSSVREAAKELLCLESSISNNLKGRSKSVFSNNLKLKFIYKCAPSAKTL